MAGKIMYRRQGIVLKKKLHQLVILDSQLGKIKAIAFVENICVGAVIDYQRIPKKNLLITSIETVFLPIELARDDINFLHHLLEILFYFLPDDIPAPELFSLVSSLYNHPVRPLTALFKKIFLVKLLLACGEYPDDEKFHHSSFHAMITESVDILANQGLDLRFEEYLDEWLLSCISTHPKIEQFKTIYFLVESRIA
jgi:hypothetical protein